MDPLRISLAELDRRATALTRTRDECATAAHDLTVITERRSGPPHPTGDAAHEVVTAIAECAEGLSAESARRGGEVRRSADLYRDTDHASARGIAAGVQSW